VEGVVGEGVGEVRTIMDHRAAPLGVEFPRLALSLWLLFLVSGSCKSKTFSLL
jgi:hypothetical protein